jgi:autotransporter-associated beta strand protein
MKNRRRGLPVLLLPTVLLLLAQQSLRAGSATWNLNPTSDDWNTAANWTPNTVPNGPTDTATFAASSKNLVTLSADTEVGSIVFNSAAGAFTVTQGHLIDPFTLTISGAGIVNNSSFRQNFLSNEDTFGEPGTIQFTNNASAGTATSFIVAEGANLFFFNASSAGSGLFTNDGGDARGLDGGLLSFQDASTAATSTVVTNGGPFKLAGGGMTLLLGNATADHGTFMTQGGAISTATGGVLQLSDNSTAAYASFTTEGGAVAGAGGGSTQLLFSSTAANGTFVTTGGAVSGAQGGILQFLYTSTAANATLIANGGVDVTAGGSIQLGSESDGGTARVEVFDNGNLDVSSHDAPGVTIGSLEGNGLVFLRADNLTIGSKALSTTLSGVVQDGGIGGGSGGSISKTGNSAFTLTAANLYAGGTTVSAGTLIVSNTTGSATGTGTVQVNAGTLGGSGIISGAVTVNGGAFLAPAYGTKTQAALTIQSALTFNAGSTYTYTFKAKKKQARTDRVVANGVTINGATFAFQGTAQSALKQGLVLTAISNTAATPITGIFANLLDGAILTVNGNNFQASYEGGDGNDLTLTVVP